MSFVWDEYLWIPWYINTHQVIQGSCWSHGLAYFFNRDDRFCTGLNSTPEPARSNERRASSFDSGLRGMMVRTRLRNTAPCVIRVPPVWSWCSARRKSHVWTGCNWTACTPRTRTLARCRTGLEEGWTGRRWGSDRSKLAKSCGDGRSGRTRWKASARTPPGNRRWNRTDERSCPPMEACQGLAGLEGRRSASTGLGEDALASANSAAPRRSTWREGRNAPLLAPPVNDDNWMILNRVWSEILDLLQC